ncbi:DUF3280 domain-containing protein [Parasalinivibrio latis]|uniref:DUF2380 domain-containing protein n=1 Tax=Parasalinivibrio latis TaxID=2952610 RepID=UPI0030DECDA4
MKIPLILFTCVMALFTFPASGTIAVLQFELDDLTQLPRTPEEIARTASVQPLLAEALSSTHGHTLNPVSPKQQADADLGFGYLFTQTGAAVELGKSVDADWIIVGRLLKPSFLYAYLQAHVVNVKTGWQAPELAVEIKGGGSSLTRRGAEALAEQINTVIKQWEQKQSDI